MQTLLPKSRAKRGHAGFTLVELALAAVILALSFGALSSTLIAEMSLGQQTNERSIAIDAALSVIEEMRGATFDEVYARYNSAVADDPDGVDTADGWSFAVTGLAAQTGDADGLPGEIVMPGDGTSLFENGVDPALGLPRDLNGDGVVDAVDHAGDYTYLPMLVRVRWTGAAGDQQVEFVGAFAEY